MDTGGRIPFEQVYEENFSYVYNTVYAMVANRENAEDITTDAFIKAMNRYGDFDPGKASVRTWLCFIARNTVIDSWRADAKRRQDVCIEHVAEPAVEEEPEVFRDETNREVAALLKKLSPAERELVAMRYFAGLSNPEIGEKLQISPKAVSERVRRVLEKCRKLAGEAGADSFK